MSLKKEEYLSRLIDEKIELYLKIFGAIKINGPKWCGKTWTSLAHSNSMSLLSEGNTYALASVQPSLIFTYNYPQLIDEWQLVPSIWDSIRNECDKDSIKGKYILTGSASLSKGEEKQIFHSGTGRIVTIEMYPMTIYEMGRSLCKISLMSLYNGTNFYSGRLESTSLEELADLIIRGGWPSNINTDKDISNILPRAYIDSVINNDVNERKDRKRDPNKMRMVLHSLARNECQMIDADKITKDVEEYENSDSFQLSKNTIADYMSVLYSLNVIKDQPAFDVSYRASSRVGKKAKKHLIDPSLTCALLNLSKEKLMGDLNTFGYLFEALVVRDLRTYIEIIDGNIFHFRDNTTDDEVDIILEFKDGSYAAIEVKLAYNRVDEAIESLTRFSKRVSKKPKFMCVIVGCIDASYVDPNTGIYVFPFKALKI